LIDALRLAIFGCALLLAAPRVSFAAEAATVLPPFARAAGLPLPDDTCQELHVERTGRGLLEIRFFTRGQSTRAGGDPKATGASLLVSAVDPERVSFSLYHSTGIYTQSADLARPIRWLRRGAELCVASGSQSVFCGPSAGEIAGTVQIAFGAGWQTRISGCAPFVPHERANGAWLVALAWFVALAALALWTSHRRRDVLAALTLAGAFGCGLLGVFDPWRVPSLLLIPGGVLAGAAVASWALLERRRTWRQRLPRIALGLFVVAALIQVPHPIRGEHTMPPVVPPLWIDSANWQPQAAHESLAFRERPLASAASGDEVWLVLGGSVAFGDGVDAHQAFPAVAQDLLRADGDRLVLLNGGVPGWNIQNIDRFLADFGDSLPLTGIVLVSILNNATLPIAAPEPRGCERSLLRAFLCNASRNQLLFTWPKVVLPKPHNPERYRRTLRGLLERELTLGRRVVLLDEASEIDEGLIQLWDAEAYRTTARELAQEFGVPFHPVAGAASQLAPGDRFLDGIHPTPALHAVLGRQLREILRER
jgi:hypothetical protein